VGNRIRVRFRTPINPVSARGSIHLFDSDDRAVPYYLDIASDLHELVLTLAATTTSADIRVSTSGQTASRSTTIRLHPQAR
jgi:hypothetical protein